MGAVPVILIGALALGFLATRKKPRPEIPGFPTLEPLPGAATLPVPPPPGEPTAPVPSPASDAPPGEIDELWAAWPPELGKEMERYLTEVQNPSALDQLAFMVEGLSHPNVREVALLLRDRADELRGRVDDLPRPPENADSVDDWLIMLERV